MNLIVHKMRFRVAEKTAALINFGKTCRAGSIVAFRREVTPARIQHLHTGVLLRGTKEDPWIMELKREAGIHGEAKVDVNMAETLDRYSRIAGKTMDYNVETQNCDVISMFLVTRNPVWVHQTSDHRICLSS